MDALLKCKFGMLCSHLGPIVKFENEINIITFGNVEVGNISTGLIHLKNSSDVCAIFQVCTYMYRTKKYIAPTYFVSVEYSPILT